jgi:nitrogen regulatory protein P-II 1
MAAFHTGSPEITPLPDGYLSGFVKTHGQARGTLFSLVVQSHQCHPAPKVEVFRLTVMDVQGFGRQKGHTEIYRGHEFTVNLLRKVEIQIAVNDDYVERTIEAITEAGRSGDQGRVGDGKIFVLPIEDCIRLRTGERGPEAI